MTTNDLLVRTHSERHTGQPVKRPRLLFLACYFPPVQAIASVRTGNIARYLARLGWEVTVVTPDPSVWRNVEDCEKVSMELDAEGINRILTAHRWRCLVPDHLNCWNQNLGWFAGGVCRTIARHLGIDRHVGWIKAVERACSSLSPKDVDVILASGSPFGLLGWQSDCRTGLAGPMSWTIVTPGLEIRTPVAHHGQRLSGKRRVCFKVVQRLLSCRLPGLQT